jgi:hypothetical protein
MSQEEFHEPTKKEINVDENEGEETKVEGLGDRFLVFKKNKE